MTYALTNETARVDRPQRQLWASFHLESRWLRSFHSLPGPGGVPSGPDRATGIGRHVVTCFDRTDPMAEARTSIMVVVSRAWTMTMTALGGERGTVPYGERAKRAMPVGLRRSRREVGGEAARYWLCVGPFGCQVGLRDEHDKTPDIVPGSCLALCRSLRRQASSGRQGHCALVSDRGQ